MTKRDERGSASVFIVGMAITLVVVAGLVFDGGGALNARMTLADDVEAAAVAGAQATDEIYAHTNNEFRIDRDEAQDRAEAAMRAQGYSNFQVFVPADGSYVRVTATDTIDTKMLSLIGFNSFEVRATATAEPGIPD